MNDESPQRAQDLTRAREQLSKGISDEAVIDRFDRWGQDLWDGLAGVYEVSGLLPKIVESIIAIHSDRSTELKLRDRQRILQPDWFQDPNSVGYVAYTDLFAGTLRGVQEKIPYLENLGITYLHLMPLLMPRSGENDGGYAVKDYRTVRSDLGTITDLRNLASALHASNISLTLDLVLNHVAQEHEWAEKAQFGDKKYQDYFYTYPNREIPDEFEKNLPEVFPSFAPGNFTWNDEMKSWVWTTFNKWQWDVNWSNPKVFLEYVDVIGFLANQGVDCLRLDAIAFIWKRMGTSSQNQPEVHCITQALKAISKIVTPALIFKAEAIVGPRDVVHYLGQGKHAGKVSELAYHNSLMVQIWSALASRDGRLLAKALSRFSAVPTTTAWATYLRCHDDIGWAIDDDDAREVGLNGPAHRKFLSDFYAGEFEGSFARGVHFQANETTGDRRTSGSAASLIGLEQAVNEGNQQQVEISIERLACAYSIVFGFGGIPLLYMGDELGFLNDYGFRNDPNKSEDNRWIHRPRMDWKIVERSKLNGTIENLIFEKISRIIRARKSLSALHGATTTRIPSLENPSVLIFERKHASGDLLEIFNLSDAHQKIDTTKIFDNTKIDVISEIHVDSNPERILPPYSHWWLKDLE